MVDQRFVEVKSQAQSDIQARHRARERLVSERTAQKNDDLDAEAIAEPAEVTVRRLVTELAERGVGRGGFDDTSHLEDCCCLDCAQCLAPQVRGSSLRTHGQVTETN